MQTNQANQIKSRHSIEQKQVGYLFLPQLYLFLPPKLTVLITNVSFHDNLSYFKDTIKTKKKLKPTVGGDKSLNEWVTEAVIELILAKQLIHSGTRQEWVTESLNRFIPNLTSVQYRCSVYCSEKLCLNCIVGNHADNLEILLNIVCCKYKNKLILIRTVLLTYTLKNKGASGCHLFCLNGPTKNL